YCLWGHTRRNAAVPVGTVLVLTLLALVLQHLVGMPNFNYLLIPLAVAGFALAPRLALLNIACVATASILDAVLLDGANLPAGRLALRLALVVPVVLLFGGGAMALRYLLNTVAELRAARA